MVKTLVSIFTVVAFFSQIAIQSQAQDKGPLAPKVDAIFSQFAGKRAPGCAVAIMKAGKVQYTNGYGLADVANGIPLTPRTPFLIASMSKQFTALATLLLVEEGKIRLDDNIRTYLPEVPDFRHVLTIRMLLNHTSGLREISNLFYLAGWHNSDIQTKADFLSMIGRQRDLNHLPGEEFSYNNTGYFLLALIVERVSGISFRQFVIDRLLRPLAMTDSDVREQVGQVIPGLATGYWTHDPANLRTTQPVNSFAGANGVVSSVADLAQWDANFYEHRIGTDAVFRQMTEAGHLTNGTEFGYGMGFFIGTHNGRRMISHAGSDYGYKADFIRFPSEKLTVTVLCNAFDIAPTPLALQVADLYLPPADGQDVPASNAPAVPANTEPQLSPATLAGLYWNEAIMQGNRFFFEDGKLLLDGGGEGKFALRPLGNNVYRLMEAPRRFIFTFYRRPDGVLGARVDVEGSPVHELRRVEDKKPSPVELRRLEGRYYSAELDVVWRFVVRKGMLVLERPRWDPIPLSAVFGKVFQSEEGFFLKFQQAPRNQSGILEVSTERARRVRFVRLAGK